MKLLLDPPEYLETAKVFDLMLAVPKYGRVGVKQDPVNVRGSRLQDDRRPVPAAAHRGSSR